MPSRPLSVASAVFTVLVVGAVTLAGAPLPSTAATVPAAAAEPDPVTPLLRATAALNGDGEATLALRDLFVARPGLGELGRRFAGGLLARPTDGAGDPFADGYQVPATRRCAEHVCVHRVRSGADAADAAWARTTLRVMEDVWSHHVDRLRYRAPVPDGRGGGNARFDVYLKELGGRGVYGYCAPERRAPGRPDQASGFCVLDNDFARAQFGRAPRQTLAVTASHEFFHAVQFAYDFGEDQWLLEQTATWMEERFADDVDDNRIYLRYGQLARPGDSLDLFEPSGYAQYGNWVFWQFLSERYGRAVVRRVIERTGTGSGLPDDYSARALRRVLRREGGLSAVFAAYAAANARPRRSYAEGRAFPPAPVDDLRVGVAEPRVRVDTRLDHLASRTVRLRPDDSLADPTWRLQVKVNAPGIQTAPAAHLVVKRANGTVRQRPVPLGPNGNGTARVPISPDTTSAVWVSLANASTRFDCDRDTSLSCRGEARDQGLPYTLKAFLVRRDG